MKAVFALYHDMEFQSRPQECIAALQLLGVDEIVLVTIAPWAGRPAGVRVVLSKHEGALRYLHFYRKAIETIRAERPDLVLLHDDFTAPILRWLVKHRYAGKILFDESELYIDEKRKIKGLKDLGFRFLPYCERKYLKRVDALMAANRERAEIMVGLYGLSMTPIVLENMRPLQTTPDAAACAKKYDALFRPDALNVLYGGGVRRQRRTLELAQAVRDLGPDFNLIVAGKGDPADVWALEEMAAAAHNIHYVGQVPRADWKYLLTRADVCVSIYAQDTPNNKFCASGRFYEGLLEGVPALATTNPPLLRACEEHGFGVADEDLKAGLMKLRANYAFYRDNARRFAASCPYGERIPRLAREIEARLAGKGEGAS